MYIVNELVSSLTHARLKPDGSVKLTSTVTLDPEAGKTRLHHKGAGGICIHRGAVYVTLRHTSPGKVAILSISDGAPVLDRVVDAGGECPRFVGSVGGKVLVCCQESGRVVEVEGRGVDVGEKVTCIVGLD